MCMKMVCQYVHMKWRWWFCICWLSCTEIEQESETASCACVFELYITDESKKGVFIFQRLFTDDSVTSTEKGEYKRFLMSSLVNFRGLDGVRNHGHELFKINMQEFTIFQ